MEEDRRDSWIEVLSHVVAGLRSSETFSDLATHAREALAELRAQGIDETGGPQWAARGAGRSGADFGEDSDEADAPGEAGEAGGGGDHPEVLAERLEALRASVEELTDLLDAGLERLETVEMQLGDPDENLDAQVSVAVERCQSRLAAIEHRLGAVASILREGPAGAARGAGFGRTIEAQRGAQRLQVLVVDGHSERRCDVCLALENQGLRCIAVADSAGAAARSRMLRPDVVLIDADTAPEEVAALAAVLAESDAVTAAAAPVMVMTAQRPGRPGVATLRETFGNWPLVFRDEGEAAFAAAVTEHAQRQDVRAAPETAPTEETTRHAFDAEFHVQSDDSNDAACDAASE
ncbi:MAG: hypothetical protein HY899_19240 [Deltaproteobacteria bacterium]|nr:hypothetical protein [Deltaproteobacteria bacterium]